jgi:hypothetical protein
LFFEHETLPEIPVVDVRRLASADLCRHDLERVRDLVAAALSRRSHVLLPLATRFIDQVSHSWLARQADDYLEEIRHVAELLGRPGAFFLNTIYEWACSTSVAADPAGDGARMIRVLDWGLSGLGRHVVIARHETPHGPFYNATWPGYAGVINAMAPGRFSAAINQAPRVPVLGIRLVDDVLTHLKVLCSDDTLLASHLLRRVFEEAPDFATAVAMLSDESVNVAMPALFALAGTEPDETCIVEALGNERRLHRGRPGAAGVLGMANQWLSPDFKGRARNEALTTAAPMTAEANNTARRAIIRRLQTADFHGSADLPEPVLNSQTVMCIIANAKRGEMMVEALDPPPGQLMPRAVARSSLRHARARAA